MKPQEVYNPEIFEWPELERLKLEKEAIGFYITGHPLDRYAEDLRRFANGTIGSLESKGHRAEVTVGCVVTAVRERPLRDGSGRMAFVTVEDLTGQVEMMVSARVFMEAETALKADVPLLVKMQVSMDRDEEGNQNLRVRCVEVRSISDARKERTRGVVLSVQDSLLDDRRLVALKQLFERHPGQCVVRMMVEVPRTAEVAIDLPADLRLEPSDEVVDRVEQLFGAGTVSFR